MAARVAVLALLCLAALAAATDRRVIASTAVIPGDWEVATEPHPAQPVQFRMLLKRNNVDWLANTFRAVSDPKNPRYGQFLTRGEIDAKLRPEQTVFDDIAAWLAPFKPAVTITEYSSSIKIVTTVAIARQLLKVPFSFYKHPKVATPVLRIAGEATLPAHIFEHVELVVGISEFIQDKFEVMRYDKHTGAKGRRHLVGDVLVIPSVLKKYYNVPTTLKATNANTFHGIAAFNDYYSAAALKQFCSNQSIEFPPNITNIGPNCLADKCDQGESDLDMQYITSMAQNVDTTFINQGVDYWILQFCEDVITELDPIPWVFSISYGWSELFQCDLAVVNCPKFGYNTYSYVNRTNQDLQQLGTQGITIVVADGDDGAPGLGGASGNCPIDSTKYCPVGGCAHTTTMCPSFTVTNLTTNELCFFPMGLGSDACAGFLNDPNADRVISSFMSKNSNCKVNLEKDLEGLYHVYSTCGCSSLQSITQSGYNVAGYVFNRAAGPVFTADYPTSSPFVTSVGATQFTGTSTPTGEITASILTGAIITTGGGFSSFQAAEDYQTTAINNYINGGGSSLPPSWSFDSNSRGYPDVAFNGHNYLITMGKTGSCPCQSIQVDGTSASSPSFAGLVSLLNDHLLNNGKTTLGFLNPLLYQAAAAQPDVFNDVTSGSNECNRAYCCLYGYSAAAGWDPVSGLGSPNFGNLLSYVSSVKGITKN